MSVTCGEEVTRKDLGVKEWKQEAVREVQVRNN